MAKTNRKICLMCGPSPGEDPDFKLFHFPRPGTTNILRCELWAKYCFPDGEWFSQEFQQKLYREDRMLCHRHFKGTSFSDYPHSRKKLNRFAVPDVEMSVLVPEPKPLNVVPLQDKTNMFTGLDNLTDIMLPIEGNEIELPLLEQPSSSGSTAEVEHPEAKQLIDHQQAWSATGSYAAAAQTHLSVAVTMTPRTDMTQAEANNIQGQIQKAIFAACIEPLAPGQTRYVPTFEGKAFLSEGVLKMWCTDDRVLDWLKAIVPQLTSPRSGTGLTVIRQTDINSMVRSALFVPNCEEEIGNIHQILLHQNLWYDVSQWTLFTYQKTTGSPSGVLLILGIPKEELPTIMARGRKVAFSTGTIYIRFFTVEGLSDVPPGYDSVPENREGPGRVRAVDEPTSHQPKKFKTDPSVNTALENIKAVLMDSQDGIIQPKEEPTPNAPDETALADKRLAQWAQHK